ncbi:MAG: hypothetical protein Q4G42_07415, partial [Neisseria sp.]|nr:hypothetical protein [Neisseria sp.]
VSCKNNLTTTDVLVNHYRTTTPAPWGRLSLLTFFDEAKKVSRRAAIEREANSFCKTITGCLNIIQAACLKFSYR